MDNWIIDNGYLTMRTEDSRPGSKNFSRKQHVILSLRLCTFAPLRESLLDQAKMRVIFFTVLASFSFLLSTAQPVIKTAVDRSEILIGEQFKLTMEVASLQEGSKITWPVIPDSIAHFEVISRSKMDSVYTSKRLTGVVQSINFTSFDSGKWVLPSFLINIIPVTGDKATGFFTDSVPVTVSFSVSDTTSQIKDIKPIREVETINPLWYWMGAGILLIALVVFLIWVYRYWKKNKKAVPFFESGLSPYDEAMKEIGQLKTHNLSVPAEIKIVHTRLGEILKRYLSRSRHDNFLNKTTGDILILLASQFPDKDMPAKVAASLRSADAVKFAKYLPPVDESEQSLQAVKEVIQHIHQKPITKPLTSNIQP